MNIIQGHIESMPSDCVLTIGKFEGIHLGHGALIKEVVYKAKCEGLLSAIIVFEPHPYSVLGNDEYSPLFTNEERLHLLEDTGLDYLIVQPFDVDFSKTSPLDFCNKIFNDFKAKVVIVGKDYRFGKDRMGNVELLSKQAKIFDAKIIMMPLIANETLGLPVSTSQIRNLVSTQNLEEAEKMLGFPFFIKGKTAAGKQVGRTIGFPTLNIYPVNKFLPNNGVYVTLTFIDNIPYPSITNVGLSPTVQPNNNVKCVESHLLKTPISENYGIDIKTEFLKFIRAEQRYSTKNDLKEQITKDINVALKWHGIN